MFIKFMNLIVYTKLLQQCWYQESGTISFGVSESAL